MPYLRLSDCPWRSSRLIAWLILLAVALQGPSAVADGFPRGSQRNTPVVRAVRNCAPSVVNIQGQKSIAANADPNLPGPATREVNGMGTGVVIDPRGYILTNFHVVDGVRQINVTLASGQRYIARIISHDQETDLAVIRIPTRSTLPVIDMGTSSDLMTGESVVAVGNAFGYEHTVTTGIISALHRNVRVNETTKYLDLIQTDASINPGNSGGPLLNIDGQMIGVNVAVRAGAQGIGFAIPVDKALRIAAGLMSIERIDNHWHGMKTVSQGVGGPVRVAQIASNSPARRGGIEAGDVIEEIGAMTIERPIDVERALLGRRAGDKVPVRVARDGELLDVELVVADRSGRTPVVRGSRGSNDGDAMRPLDRSTWEAFGLILEPESRSTLRNRGMPFSGGMRVVRVRADSSAAEQGVVVNDILVRIHRWYTTSDQDVRYVLNRRDAIAKQLGTVRFDIVRGKERYYGRLALKEATGPRR